ncbi:MAG: hypothetical protein PUF31_05145 [Oscillospiraceae bacterium]|nr:hypothetical protein [Oscillospiraceae bacterium]
MKKTRKLLAVLLCAVMLLTCTSAALAAEGEKYTEYPVIIVPGYSSSWMYKEGENGEKIHVWGIDMNDVGERVLKRIVDLGLGLGALTQGNAKKIATTVGEEVVDMLGDMACNPDGTSKADLKRYCVTAEESCSANLQELYPDGRFQHEREIMGEYANYIGKENIFNFNCDFRMGAVACANQLNTFVQSVKEYTGKDRVNILAVSHGGQVSGTYLTLFGDQGDINNAVLTVPALGGAGLAYDVFNGDINFDEKGLFEFVEHGKMEETDYNWLVKAEKLGFLDDIVNNLLPYIWDVLGYWGSMWDFVPTEYYEDMKAKRLDPVESAALIEKSDYMHYQVMPEFANGFKRAEAAGSHVSIIAGYDNKVITGLPESSDSIITIASSTGATVAPLGQRFADGYTQKVDTGFYQVSPSMTIDASTSYMPEHTWFVENLYHGMTYKDPYSAELMKTLLLTEKIRDVHSDPAFPQFHATTNVSHSVYAAFNKSVEGYVSSDDTAIVIKNLSEKNRMKIMGVAARGLDIAFDGIVSKVLEPGESVEILFRGEIPKVSVKNFDVVVDYVLVGSPTPVGERSFDFTIMNGEKASYDESNPYVTADIDGNVDSVLSDKLNNIFTNVGIKPLITILFNIIEPLFNLIVKIVKTFAK